LTVSSNVAPVSVPVIARSALNAVIAIPPVGTVIVTLGLVPGLTDVVCVAVGVGVAPVIIPYEMLARVIVFGVVTVMVCVPPVTTTYQILPKFDPLGSPSSIALVKEVAPKITDEIEVVCGVSLLVTATT